MPNTTMTSRRRMLATMKREDHDHVPFSPHIMLGLWWQSPLDWRDQFERARRMLDLGLDPIIEIWLPDVCPHPEVKVKTWREKINNEILLTKEFHTPAGILRQTVRETDDWCVPRHGPWIPTTFGTEKRQEYGMHLFDDYNVSRRTEPWVKDRGDLEKLKYLIRLPEGHLLDEWKMDTQRAMEFARKYDVLTVARRTVVGDAFQWFCDIPWFLVQFADDPEFVRDFLAVFQNWAVKQVQLALDMDVDVVQYRGWYEIPTYWGGRYFQEFLVPLIEEQTRLVHQAGKLHTYLLPEGQGAYAAILKNMKVDVLQGLDPRMLHGGDLKTLFIAVGQTKSFWGAVDAEVILVSQNREKIESEVREAVESLNPNGGLILSSFLFPEIPQQGIMYMIEAWKKYRNL
jgi:hypothetical protein